MIEGYVGLIGHGKTMMAVDDARKLAAKRGAILAANISIDPPPGVRFEQLTVGDEGLSIDQLETLMDEARATRRGVVILVDEIGVIMPARFWQSFPIRLMYRLSQSRKYATDLLWTSQDEEDVESYLRRKTQWVYKLRCIPETSPDRRERGRRPWLIVKSKWRPGQIGMKGKRQDNALVKYRRERETAYDTDELIRPAARLAANPKCRNECCKRAAAVCLAPCCTPPGSAPEVQETVAMVLPTSHPNGAQARVRSDRAGGAVDSAGGSGPFSPDEGDRAQTALAGEHDARPLSRAQRPPRGLESGAAAPGGRSPWEPGQWR